MTIGQIKEVIAANLHKTTADFVVGAVATEVDLLLLALNNARKVAEKFHDFSICRKRGYLSVLTSANWTTPTWFSVPTPTVVMRKVKNWFLRVEGTGASGEFGGVDRAIRAISQDQVSALYSRQDYRDAPLNPALRYASDSDANSIEQPLMGQTYVIIDGRRVLLYPTPTVAQVVVVDGFHWWTDWTVDADTDWWTDYGAEFLIYRAMVEANRLVTQFVGNQEGNLAPPQKEADRSLAELVSLDMDSTDGSINIFDL